jgi:hypothetical protein
LPKQGVIGFLALFVGIIATERLAYAKDIAFDVDIHLSWNKYERTTQPFSVTADGDTIGKCHHTVGQQFSTEIPFPQQVVLMQFTSASKNCDGTNILYRKEGGAWLEFTNGEVIDSKGGALEFYLAAKNNRHHLKCRTCTVTATASFIGGIPTLIQEDKVYSFSISPSQKTPQEMEKISVPISAQDEQCEATTNNEHVTISCEKVGNEFILYASSNAKPPVANNLLPSDYAQDKLELEGLSLTTVWEGYDPDSQNLTHQVYLNDELTNGTGCYRKNVTSKQGQQFTCAIAVEQYDTIYSWKVKVIDEYDLSDTTKRWYFKTPKNQVPVVENLSPCSVTAQELEPTLSWNATDYEADAMIFSVSFGESLDNQALICDNIADMTCTVPSTLAYNTNYFWQVQAKDSYGNVTKAEPCGFQTIGNQPPNKASNPTLKNGADAIDPAVNFVDPLLPLEFSWQGNGDPENDDVTYQVCYANLAETSLENITPETTLPCVSADYMTESTITLPTGKLEYDAEYVWIVSVKDSHANKSEWDIWPFKTKPAPVNLLLDAQSGYSSTLLKWTINNDANVHRYRILRAKKGEAFAEIRRIPPPAVSFEDDKALATDTEHCYQIEALDNQGKPLYQSNESCITYGITTLAMKSSGGLKGQQVDVPISLLNGGKLQIGSSDIWLRYNPKVITVTGIKKGILIDGAGVDYSVSHRVHPQPDGFAIVKVSVVDNQLNSALTGEGSLVDVIFEVIGDAGANSPLKLLPFTPGKGGSSIQDHNFADIPLAFEDNTFTVNVKKATRDGKEGPQFFVGEAYVKGDLNGNGTVQTVDARMARFIGIKKINASAEQRTAGDVNNDGLVNSADAGLIIEYALNGEWPRVGLGTDSRQAQHLRRSQRDGKDTPILLSLEDISGIAGSEVTTTLSMNDVVDLSAFNVAIVYDTQVIERIVNVTKTGLAADSSLVPHDDGNGILRIGGDTQTPINGSGAIATITVKLATGGNVRSTPLLIGQAHLYDRAGRNFTTFALHNIEADHGEAIIEDVPPPPPEQEISIQLKDILPTLVAPGAVYSASGQIRDQDGNPMVDVEVKVGDQTARTDEHGYWAIVGLNEGDYPVTVTQDGYTFASKTCIIANQHNCRPTIRGSKIAKPAQCQLYAVDDEGLNKSQFFTINVETGKVMALGPQYKGYDIEAVAIHPETNVIYAASGNNAKVYLPNGFLYKLDSDTGELINIGPTNFEEIGDLAFDSNGTLWAWAKAEGLITLDLLTGAGTLVMPSDLLIEGLTLTKDQGTVFYGSLDQQLLKYDMDMGNIDTVCSPLLGEMEALEMMAGGLILIGTHQAQTLSLQALDPNTCTIVLEAALPTANFKDVEGIALPVDACLK